MTKANHRRLSLALTCGLLASASTLALTCATACVDGKPIVSPDQAAAALRFTCATIPDTSKREACLAAVNVADELCKHAPAPKQVEPE